jgi:hypothetical protein
LGEISQIWCSNNSSFPSPFYGDHQYLPHLPSNKGGVVSPPIARAHLQLSLLSPTMLVEDGLVAGGRRIHKKLCSGGHGHLGPEVEGGGPHILWEIIGDLLEHLPQ